MSLFGFPDNSMKRRKFLTSAAAFTAAANSIRPGLGGSDASNRLKGKAKHVISIWLGGGMGQIDTFDPKRRGDPKRKLAGAYYDPLPTAVEGVEVCEHLKRMAPLMDRVTAVRSVHHEVIDEHAAATNRMHTGRAVSGTAVYPSIGSIVAHQLGSAGDGIPPYVLIGYPNLTRGPGFLGAKYGYLYLTDTSQGPTGLARPDGISVIRQSRRDAYLSQLQSLQRDSGDERLRDYDEVIEQRIQLSSPEFMKSFALDSEEPALRDRYGGEFGQRMLLSRRLVERGVRFIEVSHNLNFLNGTGWDVHNAGILQQHELIKELDQAMSTLIIDLEERRLLDQVLIVITSEFGRPPEFDGGGGRGHQGSAFTCVLAGGGLKHCGAFGVTDELSKKIVKDPVSVPDFFATILASLGVDWRTNLYDGDRPVPLTDNGQPIGALFS